MLELRKWQVEALAMWKESRRGIVAVVTGGGKTVFAITAIRWAIEQRPDVKVLVTVPTVALQEQWLEELAAHLPDEAATADSSEIARHRLLILVNDSARRAAPGLPREGPWFQVVDECHRVASLENRRTLIEGPWAALGLSATPERQYDEYLETHVVPYLGPIIYRYSYVEALRDGVISQFDLLNYQVPMTGSEQEQLDKISRSIGREAARSIRDEMKLKGLLMRRARMVQGVAARVPVAAALARDHASDASAIVFHESTDAADRIASQLRGWDVPTSVYHSRLAPEVRRRDLHLFRVGATAVMVCCRALDEGINIPRAKYAVVAASTATTRQRIQRLGRMLRPDAAGTRAMIATLYATPAEATRLVEESRDLEGLVATRWFHAQLGGGA